MLNSFASDLDSILSDLSTSPTLRGSQELVGGGSPDRVASAATTADSAESTALHVGSSSCSDTTSCPDLPGFSTPCGEDVVDSSDIPLLERLIRSHPIWYLPNIQRVAAAQLLQNQEQGVKQLKYNFFQFHLKLIGFDFAGFHYSTIESAWNVGFVGEVDVDCPGIWITSEYWCRRYWCRCPALLDRSGRKSSKWGPTRIV